MKKIIRLTESDLTRIVRRVIKEQGVRTSRQYLKEQVIKGVALDLVNKITNGLNQQIANYKTKNPNVTMDNFRVEKKGLTKTKEGEFEKYTIYYGNQQNDVFYLTSSSFTDADLQPTASRDTNLKIYRNDIMTAFLPTNLIKTAPGANKNLNTTSGLQSFVLRIFDTWATQFKTPAPTAKTPGVKTPIKP